MATRQPPRAPRNDAITVIDRLVEDVEGWSETVNESANANEVAQQLYALRERHALTQKEFASLLGTQRQECSKDRALRDDGSRTQETPESRSRATLNRLALPLA